MRSRVDFKDGWGWSGENEQPQQTDVDLETLVHRVEIRLGKQGNLRHLLQGKMLLASSGLLRNVTTTRKQVVGEGEKGATPVATLHVGP